MENKHVKIGEEVRMQPIDNSTKNWKEAVVTQT